METRVSENWNRSVYNRSIQTLFIFYQFYLLLCVLSDTPQAKTPSARPVVGFNWSQKMKRQYNKKLTNLVRSAITGKSQTSALMCYIKA